MAMKTKGKRHHFIKTSMVFVLGVSLFGTSIFPGGANATQISGVQQRESIEISGIYRCVDISLKGKKKITSEQFFSIFDQCAKSIANKKNAVLPLALPAGYTVYQAAALVVGTVIAFCAAIDCVKQWSSIVEKLYAYGPALFQFRGETQNEYKRAVTVQFRGEMQKRTLNRSPRQVVPATKQTQPIKGERKPKPPNEGPKIPPVPKRKTNENPAPPPAPNERKQVEPQAESGGGAASCTRGRGTPPAFSQLDDLLKQPNAKTKEFIMILEEVTLFINLLEDELKKAHALDTPEKKIEVNNAIESLRIKVQREEFLANYCSDIISGNTPAEELNLLKQDIFNRFKKLLEPRLKKEVNAGTIVKREVEGKWRYFKRRER